MKVNKLQLKLIRFDSIIKISESKCKMKTNGNDWLGQIIFNKTKNDDDFLIPEFEKQKTTTLIIIFPK